MAKPTYTDADVRLGATTEAKREEQTIVHTHRVIFARPLTRAEQHLFADVLVGFYYKQDTQSWRQNSRHRKQSCGC